MATGIKISQLTEDTEPTGDDFLLSLDNTSASSKKITAANLIKWAHGLSDGIMKIVNGETTIVDESSFAISYRAVSSTNSTLTPDIENYDQFNVSL